MPKKGRAPRAPSVSQDSPTPVAARVCPECGKNPRAGSPRTPWWFRRAGLPLWLAAVTFLIVALHHFESPYRFAAPPGTDVFLPRGVEGWTVGELRAAAAGDKAQLRRLTDGLLAMETPGPVPSAGLMARVILSPQGTHSKTTRGRPFTWITTQSAFEGPGLPPVPLTSGPRGGYWWPDKLTADLWWFDGRHDGGRTKVELGSLILVLGTGWGVRLALRPLARRASGRTVRWLAIVVPLIVVAIMLLWSESTVERTFSAQWSLVTIGDFRLVDAEQLARTPAGQQEIASRIARELPEGPAQEIAFNWSADHMPAWTIDRWGWPVRWAATSTVTVAPGDEDRIKAASPLRFAWEANSVFWVTRDSQGVQRTVEAYLPGLAAPLAIVALGYYAPLGMGSLLRGRRRRRYQREGRCYSCGYDVRSMLTRPAGTTDGAAT